jgi:hypothetical protein
VGKRSALKFPRQVLKDGARTGRIHLAESLLFWCL